jgi:hypothetical protein
MQYTPDLLELEEPRYHQLCSILWDGRVHFCRVLHDPTTHVVHPVPSLADKEPAHVHGSHACVA